MTYIHGTERDEQERLAGLNRISNRAFVEFLSVPSTADVLEVGSGLGILAADVASVAENVHVVGVEQAVVQIAAAARHPRVRYVQGDAHRLEFDDGAFDLVFARYLLEHVSDPTRVLSEMRRVTRQGGRVAACENDISLLRLDPPCAVFDGVWQAFQQHQRRLGGDSQIGRRLYRLFRDAGFSKIELSVQPEVHWHGSAVFPDWIQNLIGNINSARQGLVESQLCSERQVDDAVAELASLIQNRDASSCFMWNRAVASR
jgi:ubiquinone/menaquinone biosynthesis C-methylase UbiE